MKLPIKLEELRNTYSRMIYMGSGVGGDTQVCLAALDHMKDMVDALEFYADNSGPFGERAQKVLDDLKDFKV